MKISSKGRKTIHLGEVYHEHQWIKQLEPNMSGEISEQEDRWNQFVCQLEAESVRADTIVIGDTNFDFSTWDNPVP